MKCPKCNTEARQGGLWKLYWSCVCGWDEGAELEDTLEVTLDWVECYTVHDAQYLRDHFMTLRYDGVRLMGMYYLMHPPRGTYTKLRVLRQDILEIDSLCVTGSPGGVYEIFGPMGWEALP